MAEANAVVDVPAPSQAPTAPAKRAPKKTAQAEPSKSMEDPGLSVDQLKAQLAIVTRQRDTLLAALNMLKTATDERIILTQAQLNEIGRQAA